MSETAAPTPAPTAATAAPAPATEAPKPHHSALQPRAPQGTFAGAPDPTKAPLAPAATGTPPPATEPPKPKAYKLGDREITNPDDLYVEAQAALAERQALAAYAKQAAEAERKAKELEAKIKDKKSLLSEEDIEAAVLERARRWQREQEIARLPPEQQAVIRAHDELARQRAQFEAEKAERQRALEEETRQKEEAKQQEEDNAIREEFKGHVLASLKAAGLEPTASNFQQVASVIRGGLMSKHVLYSPEVIGARVKAAMAAERRKAVESASVEDLLTDANVAKLAAVEDPAQLRKLALAVGEKLRRLNLQERGMSPAPVATPTATRPAAAAPGAEEDLPPGDPRWNDVLERRLRG